MIFAKSNEIRFVKICTERPRVSTGMVGDGDDGERERMGMGTNTRPRAALYL